MEKRPRKARRRWIVKAVGVIAAIASERPRTVLTSAALAEAYPEWSAERILAKTGVRDRGILAAGETALDLAERAVRQLVVGGQAELASVDFLLFCTQTPEHPLPGNAALLHHRLGLRANCGVLDYGLGCSGYVYGLAVAEGLIAQGAARTVLLVTGDAYSRFIHPDDRSVRTLFGDAATASLIGAPDASGRAIGPFVFGADGSGADKLIVRPDSETGAPRLHMDGAQVLAFALKAVPDAVERLLGKAGRSLDDYDLVVLHQASALLLDRLEKKLAVQPERFVRRLEDCGNTVSSSIPLALEPRLAEASPAPRRALLVGFGVGYAWAAADVVI